MISLGQDELAKYPFLADSGAYLREQGFTLEQFGTDPDLENILKEALLRIRASADGRIYSSGLTSKMVSDDSLLPMETFSFLLAVVLLKLSGAHTLIRRFALAESRRAEKFLEKDLAGMNDPTKEGLAKRLVKDLFGVEVDRREEDVVMPVFDYLMNSADFNEREWKLVNRRVDDGFVYLTPHETVRLMRAKLGRYISKRITSTKPPQMYEKFRGPVEDLANLARRFAPARIESTVLPPCIKHATEVLERGVNLPHSGRFMLATFLFGRGQQAEQIAPLFKNAPDYNERITTYQLNHLSGTGGGTKYMCPSCEKLQSQNLCFAVPECDGITNPLQFGRRKSGARS